MVEARNKNTLAIERKTFDSPIIYPRELFIFLKTSSRYFSNDSSSSRTNFPFPQISSRKFCKRFSKNTNQP
jgi:hypothetical protein